MKSNFFSVSELDSDEDDDDNTEDEGMNEKPLTAKEAKQLQREWLKSRYDSLRRNGSEDELSHYENVKDQRYCCKRFNHIPACTKSSFTCI